MSWSQQERGQGRAGLYTYDMSILCFKVKSKKIKDNTSSLAASSYSQSLSFDTEASRGFAITLYAKFDPYVNATSVKNSSTILIVSDSSASPQQITLEVKNLDNRLLGKSTFFTLSGCSLWNGTLLACWMPSPWFGLLRFVLPAHSCQLFLDLFNDGCNGRTIQI